MTAFYYHPICLEHDTGYGHPERADRLRAIMKRIEKSNFAQQLEMVEPPQAELETIALVHPSRHIEQIESYAKSGPVAIDSDTVVSPRSFEAALYAAGAAVEAARRVARGEIPNAFCAMRPPGHHAEANRAMGFCLFNNVAIAAEALIREKLAEKILIIDWDVHHGNGTQDIFYQRGDVFYASFHQWPLYPGTGHESETGGRHGKGATLNVLLQPGTEEERYFDKFRSMVEHVFEAHKPDLVLLSAGFDAHQDDPLAQLKVSTEGFGKMTDFVLELAESLCGGKLVSLLEGGYDLQALAASVETHVGRLVAASNSQHSHPRDKL